MQNSFSISATYLACKKEVVNIRGKSTPMHKIQVSTCAEKNKQYELEYWGSLDDISILKGQSGKEFLFEGNIKGRIWENDKKEERYFYTLNLQKVSAVVEESL